MHDGYNGHYRVAVNTRFRIERRMAAGNYEPEHQVVLRHLVRPGDTIAVFSNGGFGGIHGKLLEALKGLK